WDAEIQKATEEQRAIAETLRDRHSVGVRATTGQPYEIDKGLMVPVLTPFDRLVFLEKAAVSYMISADRQQLPVTPEASREAEPNEAAQEPAATLDVEAHAPAEAGETVGPGQTAPIERRRRAVSHSP